MSELAATGWSDVRKLTADAVAVTIPHVLVADGNQATRGWLEGQLHTAGCRVSVARTGFEAIVKASCHLPDLIVLCDSLEDLDTVETGRLLTTCPVTSHIPVVRLNAGRRLSQAVLRRLRRIAP